MCYNIYITYTAYNYQNDCIYKKYVTFFNMKYVAGI